jgi:two-component system, cell cycle sensor histidine kinase and response regulator CckA
MIRGSALHLYLPIRETGPDAETGRNVGTTLDAFRGTETVLLIDDEGMVLEVTRKMLARYGYKVIAAHNGNEALDIAHSTGEEIALAILDMGMPGMSGPDTFPLLRMTRPTMKILICTGFEKDEDVQWLLTNGASDFLKKPWLKKPWRLEELLRKIRGVLDN